MAAPAGRRRAVATATRGKTAAPGADENKKRRAQLAQLKFEVTPLIRAIANDEEAFDRMLAPPFRLALASGFDAPLLCLLRERDGKGRLPADWARMARRDGIAEVSAGVAASLAGRPRRGSAAGGAGPARRPGFWPRGLC